MAERIGACLRKTDTLTRLGGDEFAIVQCGLSQPGAALQLAERILAALSDVVVLDSLRISTGLSIGISLYPTHASTPAALLSVADKALYHAKEQGRACFCVWTPPGPASPMHAGPAEEPQLAAAPAACQQASTASAASPAVSARSTRGPRVTATT